MFICVTEVDAKTKIPCTIEPQRTAPSMPNVKGFIFNWNNQSTFPIELSQNGTYLRAPLYYGTCDDDANTSIAGVLEVLTEAQYQSLKEIEHQARKPYPSWVGNLKNMTWESPVPYPTDDKYYSWHEETVSWVERN